MSLALQVGSLSLAPPRKPFTAHTPSHIWICYNLWGRGQGDAISWRKIGIKHESLRTNLQKKSFTFKELIAYNSYLLTMETVTDFIFLGSKITADGNCSHKIKRRLLLRRRDMTSLGSVLKSRDITLLTKVCLVKAIVFPVVMYGCASWTIKKVGCQRIDVFELWYWRRRLRIP